MMKHFVVTVSLSELITCIVIGAFLGLIGLHFFLCWVHRVTRAFKRNRNK